MPKDSKQLLANYRDIPNELIKAVVAANKTRKDYISERILSFDPRVIGIYRLTMKAQSDNYRQSAILDIIKNLRDAGGKVIVYEPMCFDAEFLGCPVIRDLEQFKLLSDIIIANRFSAELETVKEKVYTRDLFSRD